MKNLIISALTTLTIATPAVAATLGVDTAEAARTAGFIAYGDSECAWDPSDETALVISQFMSIDPVNYLAGFKSGSDLAEASADMEIFCAGFTLSAINNGY